MDWVGGGVVVNVSSGQRLGPTPNGNEILEFPTELKNLENLGWK